MRAGWASLRKPRGPAAYAFAIGATITVCSTLWQAHQNSVAVERQFSALVQRAVSQLSRRLHLYEYGLRSARGVVVAAGEDRIGHERFRAYSKSRDLDREFPGARGVGLIRRVGAGEAVEFMARARLDNKSDFEIRQLAPHTGQLYVIQYIEPLKRNRDAVGLDIASEPNGRFAAESAMLTGEATLTGPIASSPSANAASRSLLLLLPVYRGGVTPGTPRERTAAAVGWTYAPLVMDDVLRDLDLDQDGALSIVLHDRLAPDDEPVYASPGAAGPAMNSPSARISMPIFGRHWDVQIRATPKLVAGLNQYSPWAVAASGFGLTIAWAILALMFGMSRERVRRVRIDQARRAGIVEGSSDAIIGATLDGIITDWNPAAERMFGFSAAAAIGRPLEGLLVPPDRWQQETDIRAAVARGENVAPFCTVRCHQDGRLLDLSSAASPIIEAGGKVIGLAEICRG